MKSVQRTVLGVRTDMQLMWIRVVAEMGYMLSFHETCQPDGSGAVLYVPCCKGREEAWLDLERIMEER